MKPIKVALISYHTCPLAAYEGKETGGMNVYVLEVAKKLGEMNVLVDIFTRSAGKSNPQIVPVAPNVRLMHIVAGPASPVIKKNLPEFIDEFANSVSEFIRLEKSSYDIVHAHYYMSGLAAQKIFAKKKIPLVITFHTLGLMKNLVAQNVLETESTFRIENEFKLAARADYIVALSNNDKKYIEYLYNCRANKIAVVPPGVNTDIFKPIEKKLARKQIGVDNRQKIILFVGRIEPLKGIDSILYALKIIFSRSPQLRGKITLWIVGGDISQNKTQWSLELQKLEKLRFALGIKTAVQLVGQKPQYQLPLYYCASDVVVMPSHYETFGIVALEAMASGIPVIATHVAGVSSNIDLKENLIITHANSPLHLAEQIENLFSNTKIYDKSRELSQKRAARFDWFNTAKKIHSIYNSLLTR